MNPPKQRWSLTFYTLIIFSWTHILFKTCHLTSYHLLSLRSFVSNIFSSQFWRWILEFQDLLRLLTRAWYILPKEWWRIIKHSVTREKNPVTFLSHKALSLGWHFTWQLFHTKWSYLHFKCCHFWSNCTAKGLSDLNCLHPLHLNSEGFAFYFCKRKCSWNNCILRHKTLSVLNLMAAVSA